MKKIEIHTTQNVTIEYALASLPERMGAFFIDTCIIWAAIGLLNLIALIFGISSMVFFFITAVPIFFLYTLAFESLNNGQSLGKYFLKIKVVKLSNEKAEIFDYIMRWAFRMIDIYLSLGSLAVLLIYSSSRSQRLGDLLADTSVIKLLDKNRYHLKSIMKINDTNDYIPKYPEVIVFTEKEMLLIKETLERYTKYPSDGHKEAMDVLLQKIEDQLKIKHPRNITDFLKTLIKDYVFLTR